MEDEKDVTIEMDAVDAAQLKAEAKARGVPVSQVVNEKIDHGLRRAFPGFEEPNRASPIRKH